jgi:GH15 family glucan-1,4-alpha-glucosidase
MTRPLLLSNGSLHVGINLFGMVHDLYFPYVGLENHAAAQQMRHRIGVWIDGDFSWLDDGSWKFTMGYDPHGMIGHTSAHNEKLHVTLEFTDCVDSEWDVFLRNVHIVNGAHKKREIRLFLHQMLLISNSLNRDTVQYLPEQNAILHYKGRRAFVAGGKNAAGEPFTQFSIGLFGLEGSEGAYKDAEDGVLDGNVVEFGKVDSIFGFTAHINALDSTRVQYWLVASRKQQSAIDLHTTLQTTDVHGRYARTSAFWKRWLKPAEVTIAKLPANLRTPFRNNLLLVKAAADHQGGVIASTDTTMLNYWRDAYAYCWPRDAGFALMPLLRLGYKTELKNFFDFCRRGLHPDGFLYAKYQPDGAVGSSWHPYLSQGRIVPPIQEDETAIVAYLFCSYMQKHRDRKVFDDYYASLLKPMCDFMASYIDPQTKLPHASYDLWETKFLTNTYTVALVYAALEHGATLAAKHKKHADAVRWQTVADDIKMAAQHTLYRPHSGYFCKGFLNRGNGQLIYDDTLDASSLYGAVVFGLFDIDSPEVATALTTHEKYYEITADKSTVSGRFADDYYNRVEGAKKGNPWFVTTLWMAQLDLMRGKKERAHATINWVRERMSSTGVLSEQINPFTLTFVSVAPLTWSQAEFMTTALDMMEHYEKH